MSCAKTVIQSRCRMGCGFRWVQRTMYIGLGGARFAPREWAFWGRLPADCKVLIILAKDLGDLRFTVAKYNALNFGRVFWIYRGVAKGRGVPGGTGTPNPTPLKIVTDKTRRPYALALRIRLIELQCMNVLNKLLRITYCYELVGYFGLQLARLYKNLVLRWRHLYRVPRTVTRVANRPVFPGTSRISGPVSRSSRLGLPGMQICPVFSWSQGQNFLMRCDTNSH